jgi:NADH dehydrogenase
MAETPSGTASEQAPLQPVADGRTGPVLVTGATGYVGRRLIPRLLAGGLEVRALARSPETASLPEGVEVVRGDLTDPGTLGPASEGMATIVNLAAVTADRKAPPGGYESVHADGVAALVEAARPAGVARIVHMSGIDNVSGDPGPYLLGRRLGEEAVRESGVPWTMLRPSIMFGGPDSAFVKAMARLVRAPVVPVAGDGQVRIQLVWVEDVARCLETLVTDDSRLGNEYPIGGPEQLTYDEVVDAVGEAMGKGHVRKVHAPMSLVRVQAAFLQLLPSPPVTPAALELFDDDNVAAPDAIPAQFGFEPRSFREHLRAHGLTG